MIWKKHNEIQIDQTIENETLPFPRSQSQTKIKIIHPTPDLTPRWANSKEYCKEKSSIKYGIEWDKWIV